MSRVKKFLLSFRSTRRAISRFRNMAALVAARLAGERRMTSIERERIEQLELENYRLKATLHRLQARAAAARDVANGTGD
ncbi:MAG: hypothetical protein HEQ16_04430 [Bosea sp.]|nr:hypothetical protein [Bosea sp. (in: a-proteobacteria)]